MLFYLMILFFLFLELTTHITSLVKLSYQIEPVKRLGQAISQTLQVATHHLKVLEYTFLSIKVCSSHNTER